MKIAKKNIVKNLKKMIKKVKIHKRLIVKVNKRVQKSKIPINKRNIILKHQNPKNQHIQMNLQMKVRRKCKKKVQKKLVNIILNKVIIQKMMKNNHKIHNNPKKQQNQIILNNPKKQI